MSRVLTGNKRLHQRCAQKLKTTKRFFCHRFAFLARSFLLFVLADLGDSVAAAAVDRGTLQSETATMR